MKKLAVLLTLLLAGFAIAACGSSSSNKEVTPDTLVAAMDEVCTDTTADFEALGTRGLTNAALAQEFEGTAEVRQAVVDGFNELNVDDEAQAQLDQYVAASEKVIASDKAIAKAAADDDDAAVGKAFEQQTKAFDERDAVAEKLGTEVCGKPTEIRVEPTNTAPPEDLAYAEPTNTIEDAAKGYAEAVESGDCKAINAVRHTDAGELEAENCDIAKQQFKGARVVGTEQYGPAGQAEIVVDDGTHYATYFVEDLDGKLKYGGDAIHDQGGLRPAPEGNDSEAVANDVVGAIRDDDVDAFNATLPSTDSGFLVKGDSVDEFSDGKFTKDFLADVRATDDEPVQLGLNSTFGYYFLPGEKYDWVISTIHVPGIGGKYGLSGYYPVPKAE